MKRVPIQTPSAPSVSAAGSPRPSNSPPVGHDGNPVADGVDHLGHEGHGGDLASAAPRLRPLGHHEVAARRHRADRVTDLAGRRTGLRGTAACRGVRQALRHRRVRHQDTAYRRAEGGQGQHAGMLDRRAASAASKLQYSIEASRTWRAAASSSSRCPTPIDKYNRPDLTPLERSSETVGKVLKKGDVVIYESTVYPGCTEEVCVPILERVSGLKFNEDFFAGYSPERINPGDKEHRLPTIKKVTSGSTPEVAEFVDALYRIDRHGRHAQGVQHPRRRSRQGHREHAARRQHRADQRAGADLQPARDRHRRGAAGGGHQVELPAVPAGPGRRPLHRRRSVLPDAQGAGDRLSPEDDPGRPPRSTTAWPTTSPARS